jgi:predicted metal-binding membrane protein
MAILLVVGVMDLAAMAVVTIGITAERFAPGTGGWCGALAPLRLERAS